MGFPDEINALRYDESFPVCGQWFDQKTGNILEMDKEGVIIKCSHGSS